MRIHWFSNAITAHTGYGIQTALFVPRIRALGHELQMGSNYGLEGSPLRVDGMTLMPNGRDQYSNDVIKADAQAFGADIVITLYDSWIFQPWAVDGLRWCPWMPVDHSLSPWITKAIPHAYQPIAYSRYGVRELRAAGFDPLYVPHGVDTNQLAPMDREEARRMLGCPPDAFLVGMVAANTSYPSRKAFDQNIRAFAKLRQKHSDAMFYIHTNFGGSPPGEPIERLIELAGLPPGSVAQPDQYRLARGLLGTEYMRAAFSAMDVLTNATRGEGFGVPIIEAQACGTPVIVTDFSAMPELVGAGWKVAVDDDDLYFGQESYYVTPKMSLIAEAMEAAYNARGDQSLRDAARAKGLEYDADRVTREYWQPALDAIAQRIEEEAARLAVWGVGFEGRPLCEIAHDWAATGLYDDGVLCVPCRRPGCEAELRHEPDGPRLVADGFTMPYDIEDDERGGVAKIVWREIERSYRLDAIDFQPGDVALDIGAHVGLVSIHLAKQHPDITVYAFEPAPDNYARLVRNLGANEVTNVVAVNKALSGSGQDLLLTGDPAVNSGGYSALATPNGHQTVRVPSMTLQQVFDEYGIERVKLLKVDAEGAEYEILLEAPALLARVDHVRGELHSNAKLREMGHTPEKLAALVGRFVEPERVITHACEIAA